MILAGLTYSISSGFLVTDHLLDVNPCQAYASDDCLQYACQNYTSGELCPCYVDERECQYKSIYMERNLDSLVLEELHV